MSITSVRPASPPVHSPSVAVTIPAVTAPLDSSSAVTAPLDSSSAVTAPSLAMRSMLRTVERVLLRDGGHKGALVNARAAVLEGGERAALRADAWACMERLATRIE